MSSHGTGTGGKSGRAAVKRNETRAARIQRALRVRRDRREHNWMNDEPREAPV